MPSDSDTDVYQFNDKGYTTHNIWVFYPLSPSVLLLFLVLCIAIHVDRFGAIFIILYDEHAEYPLTSDLASYSLSYPLIFVILLALFLALEVHPLCSTLVGSSSDD